MTKNTKQVIVVRKFPNLRTGKYCSQVGHASMAFLTKEMNPVWFGDKEKAYFRTPIIEAEEIQHWLKNSFRKICVYVNSQEELESVHKTALDAGLISHLVTDNGATEFNGIPTMTCCAIGPHFSHKFKDITDHLPLL